MVNLTKINFDLKVANFRTPRIFTRLPVSLFNALRFFIWPKQTRRRYRTVLIAVFLVSIFAANFDYPRYWNSFADLINPRLDAINAPEPIRGFDKWGILKRADDFFTVPTLKETSFSMGLDLRGGIHLIYKADLSMRPSGEHAEAMNGLRDVIERRVNLFGVREPQIFVQESNGEYRLIAELAGVSDFSQAINIIGNAPFLEFKEVRSDEEQIASLKKLFKDEGTTDEQLLDVCRRPTPELINIFMATQGEDPCFKQSGLTGQYLKESILNFDPNTNEAIVTLELNDEGAKMFSEITGRNIEKPLAIYLDGMPRSNPTVREKIETGRAQITGFDVNEAKSVVRDLNAGALPVRIELISQQSIGASLGEESLRQSLRAGIVGFLAILIFMVALYKLSGVLAVFSLLMYIALFLAVLKLIPVTLTLPGIAGIVLSIGMSVDANILVFERLREEMTASRANSDKGKTSSGEKLSELDFVFVINRAYSRAWASIRDGNLTTILTTVILFWFTTSFVKGFALTLGIGLALNMFVAVIITKYLTLLFGEWRLLRGKNIWIR